MAVTYTSKGRLLEGKCAVITGSTRGIGYSIAEAYLEHGANVCVCGTSLEKAEAAAKKLQERFPEQKCMGAAPVLNDPESVKAAFKAAEAFLGGFDILVNNAAATVQGPTYDLAHADFNHVISVNLEGVFVCSKEAAFILRDRGGGVILSTSSASGKYGQPGGLAYPASKFAVNGMTISMARELAKDNIRVNAVAPGLVNTELLRSIPSEKIEPLLAVIPMGRLAEPEEVAQSFVFLASDMASYITGAILGVDGAGRT